MPTVRVTATGFQEIAAKLNALKLATDTEEALDVAGAYLLNQIKTRFLRQEATDGSIWPESKGSIFRKKKGRDGGTLFESGRLFESITLGRQGPGRRIIFTDVPYAAKHQFGLDGMPVREFLGISPDDELGVRNIIEARIKAAAA
jgi:phage virion morphogenesis protein